MNIIYRSGDVLFTDFGSSRELLLDDATSTESPALATRLFAAPEALMDEDGNIGRHGYKTDVFSLGFVFAEMLWVLDGAEVLLRDHLEAQLDSRATICQYHDVVDDINMLLMKGDSARIYSLCVKPMQNLER
jgi:serine/threonine protein kinase